MFEVEQTVKYLKGAVQNPEPTWNDYISENFDWKSTAVIITLPMVVVSIFVNYVLAKFVFTSSGLAHIYTGELFLKTMAFALVRAIPHDLPSKTAFGIPSARSTFLRT